MAVKTKKVKVQSVKKSRIVTKPKKTQAKREAEKIKERKRKSSAAPVRSAGIVKVRGVPYKLRKFENLGARPMPETFFTRQGKSLKELIRNTPRLFINNAVDVEAHRYKRMFTKAGRPAVKGIMWTNDPFRPDKVKRYHETYIVGLDKNGENKPLYKHKRVLAQCTCENYVYTWEYANARCGAAYLIYSNGEPPVWMNPGMAVGLCKHLIALAKLVIEDNL
uniref:SWIM-type domain-containing protein n=1 Tax=Pseudomonas phage HRDY3 TaxID=3236930 RepID=A0AB39CDU2_9VIRU